METQVLTENGKQSHPQFQQYVTQFRAQNNSWSMAGQDDRSKQFLTGHS